MITVTFWERLNKISIFFLTSSNLLGIPYPAYASDEGIIETLFLLFLIFIVLPVAAIYCAVRLRSVKKNKPIIVNMLLCVSIILFLLAFLISIVLTESVEIFALTTAFIGAIVAIMVILTREA